MPTIVFEIGTITAGNTKNILKITPALETTTNPMKETTDEMTVVVIHARHAQLEMKTEIIFIFTVSLHPKPRTAMHHMRKGKTTHQKNTHRLQHSTQITAERVMTHRPQHTPKSTTTGVMTHRSQHTTKATPLRLNLTAHTRPVVSFTAHHPSQ
jgi:hypothetical protein